MAAINMVKIVCEWTHDLGLWINESDFNPKEHVLWTEPKAAEPVAAPPAPSPEPAPAPAPAAEEPAPAPVADEATTDEAKPKKAAKSS